MRRDRSGRAGLREIVLGALLAVVLPVLAAGAAPRDVIEAVVGVRAEVPPEARTAGTLGQERLGTGVVIDSRGLVVTIGYLILEAAAVDLLDAQGRRVPAEVVGYDHDTGFGLVRARTPLAVPPVPLGRSAEVGVGDPLLVVSRAGPLGGREARLVDRREFAGYWEYLLPDALLTSPPHDAFGGAALIDIEGRLVGIGSLLVQEAAGPGIPSPGNMFVPIDALVPIMADLLATGRRSGASRPWLGVYAREAHGSVLVTGVAEDSPAAAGGLRPGDILAAVAGQPVTGLADFYRRVWSQGAAGTEIPLRVRRGGAMLELEVMSTDRLRWLRLDQTY